MAIVCAKEIIIRISINTMYLAGMPNTIRYLYKNFRPFCITFSLVISLPNHLERSVFFLNQHFQGSPIQWSHFQDPRTNPCGPLL